MQHLELFVRRECIEEAGGLRTVNGRLERALRMPVVRGALETRVAVDRHDCPSVKIVHTRERKVHGVLVAAAGYVDASDIVEDAVDFGLLPELVDRNQGVGERWHASDVSDDNSSPEARVVAYECGEVADAFDSLWFSVDACHGVVTRTSVDEVLKPRMAVPRAPAVNDCPA